MQRCVERFKPCRGVSAALLAGWVSLASPGVAAAQATSDRAATLLFVPKVMADAHTDTVIQLSNSGNSNVSAQCFYVNAAPINPDMPPGPSNPPLFQETDFQIFLHRRQPIHWVVSQGRQAHAVPPVPSGFRGELLCVETTGDSVTPIPGNHLFGHATLTQRSGGDIAKYSGIGIEADPNAQLQLPLVLDPAAGLGACPEQWWIDHLADGVEDEQIGAGSSIHTRITLVPCAHDFESQGAGTALVQFQIFNEFEERFSTSTSVTAWLDTPLTDIDSPTDSTRSVFHFNVLGTRGARMELSPVLSLTGERRGFVVVAQEIHA